MLLGWFYQLRSKYPSRKNYIYLGLCHLLLTPRPNKQTLVIWDLDPNFKGKLSLGPWARGEASSEIAFLTLPIRP